MTSFKTCVFTSLLTLCSFALVVYSCNKVEPDCTGVFCNNDGTCVNGSCQCPDGYGGRNCELVTCNGAVCDFGKLCINGGCNCPDGYEGPTCATKSTDKFLGIWVVIEDGTRSAATQYTASMNIDLTILNGLRLLNFQNHFSGVKATLKGDSIIIAQQTVSGSTIEGKGLYTAATLASPAQITLWYKVTDANNNTDDFGLDAGSPSVWSK